MKQHPYLHPVSKAGKELLHREQEHAPKAAKSRITTLCFENILHNAKIRDGVFQQ